MAALLTLKEMAEDRNLSVKTFKKYVIQRGIPHELYGRSMRFDPVVVRLHMTTAAPESTSNVVPFRPVAKRKRAKPYAKNRFTIAAGLA